MGNKSYKLNVDIEATTSLDNAKAELQHLINLKKELAKVNIDAFKDDDLKGLSELIVKNDTLNESITKTKKVVDELAKAKQKLEKSQSQEAKDLAEVNVKIQEQNKANKEAAKVNLGLVSAYDKLTKAKEKLTKSQSQEAKEVAEVNVKIQEQNKANKEAAKVNLGLVSAYDKLSKAKEKLTK